MAKPPPAAQIDCAVVPAVVVDRFEVKVVSDVMFLTLFGVGIGSINGPLKHGPARGRPSTGRDRASDHEGRSGQPSLIRPTERVSA
jgi:hypothetical protein